MFEKPHPMPLSLACLDNAVPQAHKALHDSFLQHYDSYKRLLPTQQRDIVLSLWSSLHKALMQNQAVPTMHQHILGILASFYHTQNNEEETVQTFCTLVRQSMTETLKPQVIQHPDEVLAVLERVADVLTQLVRLETRRHVQEQTRLPARIAPPSVPTEPHAFHEQTRETYHLFLSGSQNLRNAILEAIEKNTDQFLRITDLQKNIHPMLERLGMAAGVSHVCVFGNQKNRQGTFLSSQQYQWIATETTTAPEMNHDAHDADTPRQCNLLHHILPDQWEEILEQGNPIYGNVATFSEQEQAFLKQQGIASLAIVPIFVGQQWWGCIGFVDRHCHRTWLPSEISAIRTAAGLVGAAVHRYRIEEALDKNESELRKLYRAVEQSPTSIVITDTSGAIEYVNPKFTLITGYTFWEAFGQNPRILKSGEMPTEGYRELWETITAGKEWRGEFHNRKRDGNLYWELASISPVFNPHGTITHFVAVKEDITERKQAEQALRESERRYREVSELTSDYAFSYRIEPDGSTTREWITDAFLRITGLEPEAIDTTGNWLALIHPEDDERAQQSKKHVLAGQTDVCTLRILTRDGSIRWLRSLLKPVWDKHQNRVVRVYGAAQDITSQTWAEQALRESEQKFRGIVEQSTDGISLTNEQGILIEWNRGQEQITGWKRSDVLGKPTWEVMYQMTPDPYRTAELARQYHDNMLSFLQTGTADWHNQLREQEIQRSDGSMAYVQIVGFSIKTNKGFMICSVTRDFTSRKQAEEAMHEAWKAAEEATRAKSEFLANMSHEIRTPMNGVIGMTNLLLHTPLSPEQQEYVAAIYVSGNALLTLINDILDFSKIEARKLDLEHRPFNLRTCIEEAVDLIARPASEKNLALSWSIEEQTPLNLVGDAARLRQILVNLLSNAVKFTERGGVVVTVRGEQNQPPDTRDRGDYLILPARPPVTCHIAVQDTGIGIPHDHFDRLFQSFSQVDSSINRKYGGTGLGLIISKRLAEMMGGAIRVESEVGKGSTFFCTVVLEADTPLVRTAQQPVSRMPALPRLDTSIARLFPLRILLAEDNIINQKVALRILERMGYQADVAGSGQEVLDALHRQPYDVILMDVQMPEMDGIEATRRIREEWPEHAQPCIIAMTAHALDGDREWCLSSGMDDYIRKPVQVDELLAKLQNVRANRPAHAGVV